MMATEHTAAELLEADARQRMATIARMPRRGWDDERARLAELELLDCVLDAYNYMAITN